MGPGVKHLQTLLPCLPTSHAPTGFPSASFRVDGGEGGWVGEVFLPYPMPKPPIGLARVCKRDIGIGARENCSSSRTYPSSPKRPPAVRVRMLLHLICAHRQTGSRWLSPTLCSVVLLSCSHRVITAALSVGGSSSCVLVLVLDTLVRQGPSTGNTYPAARAGKVLQ